MEEASDQLRQIEMSDTSPGLPGSGSFTDASGRPAASRAGLLWT